MSETLIPIWLVMSGLPSLMYAISNHIDKHLLEEHFVGEFGVVTLLLISALVSVVALPFLWLWSPTSVIPEQWTHVFVFALVGLLHTALLWFYFMALNKEDTTTIVIFYSVLPVMGLAASNIFLGETLLPMQLAAMAVTIVGVIIVSIERDGQKGFRIKIEAAVLMFMASLCWALGDVAFKFVAIEESLWRALFWEHLILFFVGLVLLTFAPKTRNELRHATRRNPGWIISINLTSEFLYILANVVSAFPLLMVQVAAVHLVQAFQPVWVFLISLLLWRVGVSREEQSRGEFVQKTFATAIAVCGMYMLAVHTPTSSTLEENAGTHFVQTR